MTTVFMLVWQEILDVSESTAIVACLQGDAVFLGNNFQDGTGWTHAMPVIS